MERLKNTVRVLSLIINAVLLIGIASALYIVPLEQKARACGDVQSALVGSLPLRQLKITKTQEIKKIRPIKKPKIKLASKNESR